MSPTRPLTPKQKLISAKKVVCRHHHFSDDFLLTLALSHGRMPCEPSVMSNVGVVSPWHTLSRHDASSLPSWQTFRHCLQLMVANFTFRHRLKQCNIVSPYECCAASYVACIQAKSWHFALAICKFGFVCSYALQEVQLLQEV